MRIYSENHKFFKKPCKRCDKMFRPTSRLEKICDNCKMNLRNNKNKLMKKNDK